MQIHQWPFPSVPLAWGKREAGDYLYVFGIFAPRSRQADRFKRVMIVVRYDRSGVSNDLEVVTNGKDMIHMLKETARQYGAAYPASAEEHQRYISHYPPSRTPARSQLLEAGV